MPGPTNDQVSAGVAFAVGAGITVGALRYGVGSVDAPEGGFMPVLAGLLICACAMVGGLQATVRRRRGARWQPVLAGVSWPRAAVVLAALLLYALVLGAIGFALATVLFLGFLFRAVKPLSWPATIGTAVGVAAAAYAVFEVWLRAQLPRGPWGF